MEKNAEKIVVASIAKRTRSNSRHVTNLNVQQITSDVVDKNAKMLMQKIASNSRKTPSPPINNDNVQPKRTQSKSDHPTNLNVMPHQITSDMVDKNAKMLMQKITSNSRKTPSPPVSDENVQPKRIRSNSQHLTKAILRETRSNSRQTPSPPINDDNVQPKRTRSNSRHVTNSNVMPQQITSDMVDKNAKMLMQKIASNSRKTPTPPVSDENVQPKRIRSNSQHLTKVILRETRSNSRQTPSPPINDQFKSEMHETVDVVVPSKNVFTKQKLTSKTSSTHLMKPTRNPPNVGDFCFAKVRGYCEWPAIVKSIENNSAWVSFFNSSESAKCSFSKIFNLREGLRFLNKKKPNAFVKALKEMSISMHSVQNQIKDNQRDPVYAQYMELIQ